jgi:hypothetical protein
MNPSVVYLAGRHAKQSGMVPVVGIDRARCFLRFVPNAARILRYLLNPVKAGRFTAVSALQK